MTRRRLDTELVRRGLLASRTAARRAIEESRVRVAGVAEPRAASLVAPSAAITIAQAERNWAGRGGEKLAAGLTAFAIDPAGRRCLDIGASTGGFTDVLLTGGAASVTALDVGYGQLVWRLRQDPRVEVVDRTNFRHVDLAALGAPFDVVVVDVSFISVALLAGQLAAAGGPDADYVVLVKPQFEVGKGQVGKGGIVSDPALHRATIERVVAALDAVGVGARGVIESPIHGAKGNTEFLLHLKPGPAVDLSARLSEVIAP
ncbi:MAG: TlyA family RNA methyltransferase [Actinobacteria bacterium]|nr:TlyA family RNA methyltransferase [Actinomycetota bacterium]MBU1493681.1 TlyA family RNA methyltransferase [Actinomycetota bacterium]MBU1865231.1 TlyA family RNA methyltransferase [Actinomycetota bacterium]